MKFTLTIHEMDAGSLLRFTKFFETLPGEPQGVTVMPTQAIDKSDRPETGASQAPTTKPPAAEPAQPELTPTMVRKQLGEYLEKPVGAELKKLIKTFGATSLASIPADKLPEYLKQALALIENHSKEKTSE